MPERLLFDWPVENAGTVEFFLVIQVVFENCKNQVPMTARESVHDNGPPDFTCAESFNQSWVFSELVSELLLSGFSGFNVTCHTSTSNSTGVLSPPCGSA